MLLHHEYTYLGRCDAMLGCPGPWATAGMRRGESVRYGCVKNARYTTDIAEFIYTSSVTTAQLYISRSIPCYAWMARTMGDGCHTAWSLCAQWLGQEHTLYYRNSAVTAQSNYTPSVTTARLCISSSIPCYPLMARTIDDGCHTAWSLCAL